MIEKLLDRLETAVSRHRAANANFSRCSPGEIADALKELQAARQAIVDHFKGNEIRWMNIVTELKHGKKE